MASVGIRDVKKAFGPTQVIHGVDISIADGEFVVLVGPSGCGKSTLLRMIAGLENISGGEIRIGERVVNNVPPKERDIAMVFQNYALYPHMTVAANMGFSLKLRGAPKTEIDDRVDRAAAILGLKPLLDLRFRHAAQPQREGQVVVHALVRVERVGLEDHGHVAVARREVVHDLAADPDLARGDLLEPGDHPERRRLAAARRADEHHELALGDVEVEVAHRSHVVAVEL